MEQTFTREKVLEWLASVTDPEVPVLTIIDLGIVRDVKVDGKIINVVITPTYSGCPAMDMISIQIRMTLLSRGASNVNIEMQLSPAWTTDWMSEEGKVKLKKYGIAPPIRKSKEEIGLFEEDGVPCPKCDSDDTSVVSGFGPTSCKSLYKCNSCKEPFEHFKCH